MGASIAPAALGAAIHNLQAIVAKHRLPHLSKKLGIAPVTAANGDRC